MLKQTFQSKSSVLNSIRLAMTGIEPVTSPFKAEERYQHRIHGNTPTDAVAGIEPASAAFRERFPYQHRTYGNDDPDPNVAHEPTRGKSDS